MKGLLFSNISSDITDLRLKIQPGSKGFARSFLRAWSFVPRILNSPTMYLSGPCSDKLQEILQHPQVDMINVLNHFVNG